MEEERWKETVNGVLDQISGLTQEHRLPGVDYNAKDTSSGTTIQELGNNAMNMGGFDARTHVCSIKAGA